MEFVKLSDWLPSDMETTHLMVYKEFIKHGFDVPLGKPSKTTWRIFSVKGGREYPPFPQRVFGQDDISLRGEGGTPQFREGKFC